MDTKPYRHGGFVGEAKVYIGGLMSEGSKEGQIEIKPAPYNVVLEDDTYKGQIKIGLKFFANKEKYVNVMGKQEFIAPPKKETSHSILGCVMKLWRKISWWKVLLFGNKKEF
ncbi:hypothetical protein PIB30_020863 [Stylosanthes scabra]|uniref:Uncharacterized protein n=1 Tax=Stylosanthes scabra TaxID=79078 RepID=A0ABU6V6S2_9FABA|nr:hypothetical protein [Stylosanthes scabra]